jgi:hypothetical protein
MTILFLLLAVFALAVLAPVAGRDSRELRETDWERDKLWSRRP